jgi:hypothetical protein
MISGTAGSAFTAGMRLLAVAVTGTAVSWNNIVIAAYLLSLMTVDLQWGYCYV